MIRFGQALGMGPHVKAMARLVAQEAWRRTGMASPSAALVLATPDYPLAEVRDGMGEVFGNLPLAGGHCPGVFACSTMTYSGIGVLLLGGQEASVHVGWGRYANQHPRDAGVQAARQALHRLDQSFPSPPPARDTLLVLLCDATPDVSEEILRGVIQEVGHNASIAGGCLRTPGQPQAFPLLVEDQIVHDAVLAIALHTAAPIGSALRHGYQAMEAPLQATRIRGQVVEELDWSPAASHYASWVQSLHAEAVHANNVRTIGARYPLGLPNLRAEHVLRRPLQWTEHNQLRCVASVPPSSPLHLMVGHPQQLLDAVREAGQFAAKEVRHHPWGAGLLFSDLARGEILGHTTANREMELRALHQGLGSLLPLFGALTSGQFGALRRELAQVHTQAFQINLFAQSTPSSTELQVAQTS